jgi:hypothetical protein
MEYFCRALQDPFGRNKRANLNYYGNRLCFFLEGFLGEGGMSILKVRAFGPAN